MKKINDEKRIFEQAALHSRVADVDGANEAICNLQKLYQKLGVPRRDARRVTERIRSSIDTGKAHNQAKRSERLMRLLGELQDLLR